MNHNLPIRTTVLPGGRIELHTPGLPEGRGVTVLILAEGEAEFPQRSFREIVGDYQGGMFKTAEEVDRYIREERDSWDR